MFYNNISVTLQQTKKGESFTYDTPSLLNQTHNSSYNIILKLIIPMLQPFDNIFPIFHKALFLLFLVQITIAKIPPVNIYNQNSYIYKF